MVDLQITAVPKDALVSVDGVDQGKAPKKVKVAVGSTVVVTAKAFGYKPMTQTVTVAAKNDPLRFNLETMSFVLTVTTTPSDAHVLAGNFTGDNQTPMDLGYLGAPLTVTVTKSGWAKKQKRVTPDMFTEQDGRMVATLDVGLQRTGPAPAATEPAPSSDSEPAPTPKPTPRPDPAPEAAPTPAPTPKPEPRPEPAPSPAALPDNPF